MLFPVGGGGEVHDFVDPGRDGVLGKFPVLVVGEGGFGPLEGGDESGVPRDVELGPCSMRSSIRMARRKRGRPPLRNGVS